MYRYHSMYTQSERNVIKIVIHMLLCLFYFRCVIFNCGEWTSDAARRVLNSFMKYLRRFTLLLPSKFQFIKRISYNAHWKKYKRLKRYNSIDMQLALYRLIKIIFLHSFKISIAMIRYGTKLQLTLNSPDEVVCH